MKAIDFKCEIITPMFMAGADGSMPELRPSSIKGMMRFWWRALNGYLSGQKLLDREAEIFGGSGEGHKRSEIILKSSALREEDIMKQSLRHKPPNENSAGISYLLYSMLMSGRERPYIKTNTEFTLSVKAVNKSLLNEALASLWGAVYLGGFGSRARRGGGNIIVKNVGDRDGVLSRLGLEFIPNGDTREEIICWLKTNLQCAKDIVNRSHKTNFVSERSNLSLSRIVVAQKPENNWMVALNKIGTVFKEFRDACRSDIYDAAVFGLPVMHKPRNGKRLIVKASNKIDRRSSPLIFKIIKTTNGNYYWYVIRLAGEFLPEKTVIKADDTPQKPDYRLIDEFWPKLNSKKKKNRIEDILLIPDRLAETVEKIRNEIEPEEIILFGSKARGDFHSKSDTDIAIVGGKQAKSAIQSGAVDIVDYNRANEKLKSIIDREGIVI